MRILIIASVLFFTLGLSLPTNDESIPNFYEPRYEIFTSGQPTERGFQQLANIGIRTIINVLPDAECLPGEPAMIVPRGMKYYHVPFDPSGLSVETIYRFSELMITTERPMLVHCSTGNHVGGLWVAYRVLIEHASLPLAVQEGRRIGMKPSMEHTVLLWLTDPVTRAALEAHSAESD